MLLCSAHPENMDFWLQLRPRTLGGAGAARPHTEKVISSLTEAGRRLRVPP